MKLTYQTTDTIRRYLDGHTLVIYPYPTVVEYDILLSLSLSHSLTLFKDRLRTACPSKYPFIRYRANAALHRAVRAGKRVTFHGLP